MTLSELSAEYNYRVEERLGILGVSAGETPTPEQLAMAQTEAEESVEELSRFKLHP